jgi:site-specific recombinase XerD
MDARRRRPGLHLVTEASGPAGPEEPVGVCMHDSLELVAEWRTSLRGRGLNPHTIRAYSYGAFRLATEYVEGPITQTTSADIDRFLGDLGNRASARSVYARGIRSLFRFLREEGHLPTDPAWRTRVPKPRHRPAVALTEEELIRYLLAAAWRSPRRAWAILLCFGAGLRRAELASLRPEDVQGDELQILGKGNKRRRVRLSEYARVAIAELRPWTNGTILGGVDAQAVTAWAHEAAIDSDLYAKVERRPAHVLRASFATHLLRNGAPVVVVRDLLGHESIATTNTYAVGLYEDQAPALDRLRFPTRPGLAESPGPDTPGPS